MPNDIMQNFPDWVDLETLIEGSRAIIGTCKRANQILLKAASREHLPDNDAINRLQHQGEQLHKDLEKIDLGDKETIKRTYTVHKKFADENRSLLLSAFRQRFPDSTDESQA